MKRSHNACKHTPLSDFCEISYDNMIFYDIIDYPSTSSTLSTLSLMLSAPESLQNLAAMSYPKMRNRNIYILALYRVSIQFVAFFSTLSLENRLCNLRRLQQNRLQLRRKGLQCVCDFASNVLAKQAFNRWIGTGKSGKI